MLKCPNCQVELDRHTCVEHPDYTPAEGDITVCNECGGISVFTADLNLELPDEEWFTQLQDNDKKLYDEIVKAKGMVIGNKEDLLSNIRYDEDSENN